MTKRAELKRAPAETCWPAVLFIVISTAALALASSAHSNSPPPEPSPAEVRLAAADDGRAVELRQGQDLVINLEANPSTGYAWQVDQGTLAAQSHSILVQTGESFEAPRAQGSIGVQPSATVPLLLGAPEIQTLRFQAVQAGQTSLRLVYRRPWEEVPPAQEFSVSVEAIGPFTHPPPTTMENHPQSGSPLSVDLGDVGPLDLPATFNWCALGACTPVRNQGNCGSCWAFSTVAPLESNIIIHDGTEMDLAEQYLLSCNRRGWDCGGGWFAHDYHQWDFVPGEPGAGGVYEADFPYTGHEDACNPPHTHHEKIVDWEYVANDAEPSVAEIKNAILDHGPVSVAVCSAGSAFHHYSGGVYDTSECTAVDHAVVLVGWDDDQGTNGIWYLRNSWGSSWGEGGYMRIGYGINSVGYAANYVVYQPTCHELDTEVYPAGTGTVVTEPLPDCSGGYEPDTVVKLTAEGDPGWHLFTWGGDASGSDNPTTITMDADKSVAAYLMCDDCTRRHMYPLAMKQY